MSELIIGFALVGVVVVFATFAAGAIEIIKLLSESLGDKYKSQKEGE